MGVMAKATTCFENAFNDEGRLTNREVTCPLDIE